MRYLRSCPLAVMLAISLLAYEVIAGVPKVLAFADQQMGKKNYYVEELEEFSSAQKDVSGTQAEIYEQLSGGDVSGMDISGDELSGNDISEGNLSGDDVSGGEEAGVSVSENGDVVSVPEAEFVQVDADYFADALFIGDSRTVGLCEYSDMEQATFYASTGLTVYKVFDAQIVEVSGSKTKITIEDALKKKQFGKIYFMIGINEMGTGTVDSFMETYAGVVAHLQELQPNAIIFVQAIMRVTTERSNKGDYINNQGIDERNERIAQLADNQKVFYLDVNPLISDETGGLNSDYTFDGVHLKAMYIPIWTDFLSGHGIVSFPAVNLPAEDLPVVNNNENPLDVSLPVE